MICAVLVAAGTGTRSGLADGKQMTSLAGEPMLVHTLRAFEECAAIDAIVIVCHPARVEECRERVVKGAAARKVVAVVAGGSTRTLSVAAGLEVTPQGCDVVVVHDGARPLIEPSTISDAIGLLESSRADGVVVGHPVIDTLKSIAPDGRVIATVDRAGLWAAQTPQVFRASVLRSAHRRAEARGSEATDDAALVEADGGSILMLEGPRWNFKVTLAEDIEAADALLLRRKRDGGAA
jgi:2-C-methyl-D-erythritol 4-phosphate cytidylyltransferase